MAMTAKERQQALILAIVVGVALGGLFWVYWRGPKIEEQTTLREQRDSLTTRVENARRDLASGTVESIRQSVEDFESMLVRMTDLVPTGNEVTTLIDEISARAKRNGVEIAEFSPLAVEVGQSFDIYRYRWTMFGHYDEIGVLMSDIAGLRRIMVPEHGPPVPVHVEALTDFDSQRTEFRNLHSVPFGARRDLIDQGSHLVARGNEVSHALEHRFEISNRLPDAFDRTAGQVAACGLDSSVQ